jgi:hypothetical protein
MENNHQIIYIGLDGKIIYKSTFQRGIPTNKAGLGPVMVIEKDGKLIVWNVRTDKITAKGTAEILEFDEKGEMSVKVENAEVQGDLYSFVGFGDVSQKTIKTLYDNGKVTLMRQKPVKYPILMVEPTIKNIKNMGMSCLLLLTEIASIPH